MREAVQTIMAMLGSLGFSLLFQVRGRKLIAIALGGGFSWIVYLTVLHRTADKALGLMAATIMVGIISEILARVFKAPVTILLVPILIPLIPGGDLYYTTSYLVRGQAKECAESMNLVIREAGAIAFGIILVACLVQVVLRGTAHLKSGKSSKKVQR